MAVPRDKTARLFYRAGRQRWDDAKFLFTAGRTVAAVYLAGYAVECLLKALIIGQTAAADRSDVVESFRGGKAHDFEWLRDVYYKRGGARLPPAVAEAFTAVAGWGVALRYQPGSLDADRAAEFFAASGVIIAWADQRL